MTPEMTSDQTTEIAYIIEMIFILWLSAGLIFVGLWSWIGYRLKKRAIPQDSPSTQPHILAGEDKPHEDCRIAKHSVQINQRRQP